MSDLLPCPFCGEVPSIMSAGMAGQPRWQHPVNDTCPIAGHYLGGWDFPVQWNQRALPAVQPEDPRAVAMRDAIARYRASSAGQAIADLIDRPAAPHVNETQKNEHDERVMLAPNAALFRGPA